MYAIRSYYDLVQFALMGSVYASQMLGKETPRVGLLSNGEEDSKGNELTRGANLALRSASLNYKGYIEGRDIYNGNADVVRITSYNVCYTKLLRSCKTAFCLTCLCRAFAYNIITQQHFLSLHLRSYNFV